jgi:hypothetical protein
MTTVRLALLFWFVSCALSGQQDKDCLAGVYKTRNDLIRNNISHKINTGKKGYKFGFLFPADLKLTVKIETPDTTLEFKPGTIYGYHQCGRKFRYYEGGDLLAQEDFYRIEETSGLVIYTSVMISGSEVFYSRDLASPIRRLLMKNIEEDFSGDPGFVEAVKAQSKKELDGVAARNDNGYLINQVYASYYKGKRK